MHDAALILSLTNFGCIGLLPVFFFQRRGALTLMWWLTALPFFLSPLLLGAAYAGHIAPPCSDDGYQPTCLAILSLPFSLGSVALLVLTLGTHRQPLALWHQPHDTPTHLIMHGAYRHLRHPFYTAYLLALFGVCVLLPHPGTWLIFVYGYGMLHRTATREERCLQASPLGAAYTAYMRHTGRFWPKRRRPIP
jgi:Isoprenylcysteine carboxyl methyltransferase (ICMT) family